MQSFRAVTMCSPTWNKYDSYGRLANEARDFLLDRGVIVNTIGHQAPNPAFLPTGANILHGYPTNFDNFGKITRYGTRIAVTMWESSRIHPAWVEPLNTCDRIIVPCHWNKRSFEDGGVTPPIEVVPLGVSSAYHYVPREERSVFRFLTIGDRGHRKGFIEAIQAFVRAFDKRDDVELVIKARVMNPSSPLLRLSNTNIRIINESYTDEEMQRLYANSDCMVFPAHGEGFGLPPREFAATGGISIVTDYGGLHDDLPLWGWGIGYKLIPAWRFHERFQGVGEWADADVDELAAKMVEVREMAYAERMALGRVFSRNALALYRWSDYSQKIMDAVGLSEPEKVLEHGA